jgi:Glycosyl hydrolases family 16
VFRSAGVVLLTAVALVGGAATALAAVPTGSTPSATNTCSNPRLASGTTGWSMSSGGFGQRVAVTGHASSTYAYRASTFTATPVMTLPAQAVAAGQAWRFAADSLISGSGGRVKLAVDFYDAAGRRLSHVDGTTTAVTATAWARVPLAATAPAGATRAVLTQAATLTRGAAWSSTACDYTPPATSTTPPTTTTVPPTTTTVPPTTVPPTTTTVPPTTTTTVPPTTTTPPPPPPPVEDGTQAATVLGWGTPTGGDEFEGTAVDTTKWWLYDGKGHGGNGIRSPQQMSVAGGVMTMSGTANGTTGGMGAKAGHLYGRWETRMRVPAGDSRYHPVLILWPDAEDWPTGGEVDYAETTCAATNVDFFLHYSAQNQQTHASTPALDIKQWHNYAVEWTATGVKGYVDGVLFFTDTNAAHLPPRSMHQTIQLDWFPSGSTPSTPSSMQIAWNRYYPA